MSNQQSSQQSLLNEIARLSGAIQNHYKNDTQQGYSTGHSYTARGRPARSRGAFSRIAYGRGRGMPPARPTGSRNLTLVNKHCSSTSTVVDGNHPVTSNTSNSDSNSAAIVNDSVDTDSISSNNTTATTTGYIRRGNKLVRSDIDKASVINNPMPATSTAIGSGSGMPRTLYVKPKSAKITKSIITLKNGGVYKKNKNGNKLVLASTSNGSNSSALRKVTPKQREIVVDGITFFTNSSGRKLVRKRKESDTLDNVFKMNAVKKLRSNQRKPIARIVNIDGVPYTRTKRGNLIRVKVDANGSIIIPSRNVDHSLKYCRHYHRLGSCPRQRKCGRCRYIHDPSRVALCANLLLTGECTSDNCHLSHTIQPEKQPHCIHFQIAQCRRATCRFAHIRIDPNAPVCRLFARYGYCDNGDNCYERHLLLCPFYATYGHCTLSYCTLPHSLLRKPQKTANATEKVNQTSDNNNATTSIIPSVSVAGLLPDFTAMQRVTSTNEPVNNQSVASSPSQQQSIEQEILDFISSDDEVDPLNAQPISSISGDDDDDEEDDEEDDEDDGQDIDMNDLVSSDEDEDDDDDNEERQDNDFISL
ncbi:hypothetical protein BDF22DRAFT_685715 [Syncephalis plumigaleata]|nr:hypothetical protein BDF22DRAFT_685715 [Syncephalis plumigaleata]